MSKRILVALIVLNALVLPCGCLPLLILFNAFNPMQSTFIADISITNETAEPLSVTLVGASWRDLRRRSVPMFTGVKPAFPARHDADFPVMSGETIVLYMDWDDVNLTEIVVEHPSGRLAQLVVDPDPPRDGYYAPQTTTFAISDFDALDPVHEDVVAALHHARNQSSWYLSFWLLGPWITFAVLLRALKRRRRKLDRGGETA